MTPAADPRIDITAHPAVLLVSGVNGTGKTTSIGKIAWHLREAGRTCVIGAADTFRAAAGEQLETWATRAEADFVSSQSGADPAAVAFDAVSAAEARGRDVVIVDTAGRLHTQGHLMDELRKIHRVIAQRIPGAPHEVLLTIDATTGQNGLQQARLFAEAVDGHRDRPDQARRHGEGRHRARDRARARHPGEADRDRRGHRGPAPVRPCRLRPRAVRRRIIGARHRLFTRLGFPDVRIPLRPARRHPRRPARPGPAERGGHSEGDARDPPRAARGGRELRRRARLRGQGARAGDGRRGDAEPHTRPAGREDRARGADRADGQRRLGPLVRQPAADRDPDGGPAGLGQDHRLRQAGPAAGEAEALAGDGGLRPAAAGRRAAAADARQVAAGAGVRPRHRRRPGRGGGVGGRAGPGAGPRRGHRRHRRPPARRRGADGRARADQEGA